MDNSIHGFFFKMGYWFQILRIWLGFYVGRDYWVEIGIRNVGVVAEEIKM